MPLFNLRSDSLATGESLSSHNIDSLLININRPIYQRDDRFIAAMQKDGNFVLYYVEKHIVGSQTLYAKWATNTDGQGTEPYNLTLQQDGNLVLTDGTSQELWRAPVQLHPGLRAPFVLVLQRDGNLVLYDANTVAYWATNTAGQDHA